MPTVHATLSLMVVHKMLPDGVINTYSGAKPIKLPIEPQVTTIHGTIFAKPVQLTQLLVRTTLEKHFHATHQPSGLIQTQMHAVVDLSNILKMKLVGNALRTVQAALAQIPALLASQHSVCRQENVVVSLIMLTLQTPKLSKTTNVLLGKTVKH